MYVYCFCSLIWFYHVNSMLVLTQIDAEDKLKDMKRSDRELEMKGKGYKKRLHDLQNDLMKHLEQYVD